MVITTILVIAYCIVGAIFSYGITKEYKQDETNELNSFSPTFVKTCIVCVSLLWPVLIAVGLYKTLKENK